MSLSSLLRRCAPSRKFARTRHALHRAVLDVLEPRTYFSIPSAPTTLVAATASAAAINLSWQDNSANETGFKVEESVNNSSYFQIASAVAANTTTYQAAGLQPNTAYSFRVRAYNSDGNSAYTNVSSATTDPAPAAPTGLTATAASQLQINLAWTDNATTETSYKIEESSNGGAFFQVTSLAANTTSYSATGLTAGTAYQFRVRAANAANSAYSNTASATTLPAPAAPTSLALTVVSQLQINLVWTDNATNETSYKVEESNNGGTSFFQLATLAADATSYNATGLTAGMPYQFRVRAANLANGAYSNTASATTLPAPAAPTGLGLTVVSQVQIDLAWTDNATNETNYKVEESNNGGASFFALATLAADSTTYSATGLTAGTTYQFRVKAVNLAASPYSNTASVTTLPAPAAPSGLGLTVLSPSQIALVWTDNASNETAYKVERSTDGTTFGQIAILPADSTGYLATGLSETTTYYFRVRATNLASGPYSAVASATTSAYPAAPSNLTATVSGFSVALAWQDNSATENGFIVQRSTDGVNFANVAYPPANATSYSDLSVDGETSYTYRVRGYLTLDGFGAASTSATAVTAWPKFMSALNVAKVTSTSAELSWAPGSPSVTGYRVETAVPGGGWTTVADLPATAISYTDTAFVEDTLNTLRIVPYNAAGDGVPTAAFVRTPAGAADGTVWQQVGSVNVNADGSVASSGVTLQAGVRYELVASGTVGYGGPGGSADAEFANFSDSGGAWNVSPQAPGHVDYGIDLNNTDTGQRTLHWGDGSYQSSHSYATTLIGDGSVATFNFHDDYYPDNSGSMNVMIYQAIEVNSLTVSDHHNLTNTITADSSEPLDMYVGQQDDNSGQINLAADFTPASAGGQVLWHVSGGTASATDGTFAGGAPPAVTLTPDGSGNTDFTVQLALDSALSPSWGESSATILRTIHVHLTPSISVVADPVTVVGLGNTTGSPTDPSGLTSTFTFTRHGGAMGQTFTVPFTLDGNAVLGKDFLFEGDLPAIPGDPLGPDALATSRTVEVGDAPVTLTIDWLKGSDRSVDETATVQLNNTAELSPGLMGSPVAAGAVVAGSPATASSTKPAVHVGASIAPERAYVPTLSNQFVPEEEKHAGLGIRKDQVAAPAANNLIKLHLSGQDVGATYDLVRDNANINVFDDVAMTSGEITGADPAVHTSSDFTLAPASEKIIWVEWTGLAPAPGSSAAVLTLEEHLGGEVTTPDFVTFFPFTTLIGLIAGHTQGATSAQDYAGEKQPDGTLLPHLENYADKGSGTHTRALELYKDGYDVLPLSEDAGNDGVANENKCGLGVGVAETAISDAASKRGVKHIALLGYSHGGGSIYNVSQWIAAPAQVALGIDVPFTAYIDAIQLPTPTLVGPFPLKDMPLATAYHVNFYESIPSVTEPLFGGPMTASPVLKENTDFDDRVLNLNKVTHTGIDRDISLAGKNLGIDAVIYDAILKKVALAK